MVVKMVRLYTLHASVPFPRFDTNATDTTNEKRVLATSAARLPRALSPPAIEPPTALRVCDNTSDTPARTA